METESQIGEVKIADDVVATIAGLATTEVEGVASMQGNLTNEIVGKLGLKNLSKGVKIELMRGKVVRIYVDTDQNVDKIKKQMKKEKWLFREIKIIRNSKSYSYYIF